MSLYVVQYGNTHSLSVSLSVFHELLPSPLTDYQKKYMFTCLIHKYGPSDRNCILVGVLQRNMSLISPKFSNVGILKPSRSDYKKIGQ